MIVVVIYILVIIVLALIKKVDVVESFTKGVKSSYPIIKNLLPSIMFFLLGVNIFLHSGIIELLEAFCERSNLIPEIIIQLILRPISNSSSLIMMTKVFEKYGVDSFLGKLSSIIQASTDTTLYIIIVYFSTINIKKIGKTLLLGFLTNILTMLFCIVVSYIILSIF